MRIVVILLVLANLALFALTRFDAESGEPQRLAEQVQPEKVRLLSPQEAAALRAARAAAPEVCVEWGPFAENDRVRAMNELAPLGINDQITARRVDRAGAV